MADDVNLTSRVRSALKEKWLNDDHDIDMERMCAFFNADREE